MTQIETTAKNAYGAPLASPSSAGSVITSAATQEKTTAYAGTRWGLSRVHMRQPGTARSRENAYVMREQLVTHAMPQNSWPIVAITTTSFCQPSESEVAKTAREDPAPSLMPFTSVAANVIASSTIHPPTPDQKTARQTPCAAALAAPCVSSEMWALAS